MAGAHYHITYCQILETERRIKLSNIIKLIPIKCLKDSFSIKEFLDTFSSFDYHVDTSLNLVHYISQIQDTEDIDTDVNTLQSIVFIAGF